MTLPWKIPRACVVHHAFEDFAAGALGHLVIDHQARIGVLLAAQHVGAGNLGFGALRHEFHGAVLAVGFGARGQGEILEHGVLAECCMGMSEVDGIGGFEFNLDAVKPCAFDDPISVTELLR